MTKRTNFGFHPYIRQGKVAIISSLPRRGSVADELSLSGLAHSLRAECDLILEAPFNFTDELTLGDLFKHAPRRVQWSRWEAVEKLIELNERVEFRIMKCREPSRVYMFNSRHPYSGDHFALLGFDDIVALILAC